MAKIDKKLRGGFLGLKVRTPKGIKLDNKETVQLINLWKEDSNVIEDNSRKLVSAEQQINNNLERLPDIISEVATARNEALRFFKQTTKDPVKKREWARRLIVANRSYESIKASQNRMEGMKYRIKGVVMDASLEKKALDVRISEAQAYVQMGDGISLVGDSLIAARNRSKTASVEFSLLEIGVENLEGIVKNMDDDKVIKEASKILGENA